MNTTFRVSVLLGSALLATAVAAAPQFKTGPLAEITFDGLHRIEDPAVDMAWAKLDINLTRYTKVMLMPVGMAFKADGARSASSAAGFPLSDRQKQMLRDTVQEAFAEELGKLKQYTITDQPGPDVLLVCGALLDVVSHVPPQQAARGGYVLRDVGEATLVLELRDSMSEEILARVVDRRAASSAFPRKASAVSTQAEVRNAAHHWAGMLRKRLDGLSSL